MNVYVDTSIVIRILFDEPHPLPMWGEWQQAYSSRLWHTEALRVLERIRLSATRTTAELIRIRQAIDLVNDHFNIYPITEPVLSRAGETLPVPLGTLDAIHLATALFIREKRGLDTLLTHDTQLATAARSMGFKVVGVAE